MLCSISERIHSNLPEEVQVLFHAFKNMNISNQLKSSTSHIAKVSLHDFTDLQFLHVKLSFYGGVKAPCWKVGRMGRNIFIYLHMNTFIYVFVC